MRLTVPGAGPGRWKTNTPSTEPPHARGLDGGGMQGTRAPHRCTSLTTSSCHHQQCSWDVFLTPCCFREPCQQRAMSWLNPAPAPRLGQCWGFGRLKASVPFWSLQPLLFPSGPRVLLGLSWAPCISSLGMPIMGWQPEAVTGSIIQPKHLGTSPLG